MPRTYLGVFRKFNHRTHPDLPGNISRVVSRIPLWYPLSYGGTMGGGMGISLPVWLWEKLELIEDIQGVCHIREKSGKWVILKKVREKSGKFAKFSGKSGKSQGKIMFSLET